MTTAYPPGWAEGTLRLLLPPRDRDSVSGDLLEEYRETVVPTRGRAAADRWYVRQVLGFAWRAHGVWAALLSLAFAARTLLDALAPTADFHLRSETSTGIAVGVFLAAGFLAAWRTRDARAGVLAGLTAGVVSAGLSVAGAGAFLALRHDPATLSAIDGSGGVGEIFSLPVMVIVPGTMLAGIGAIAGVIAAHLTVPPASS